MQPNSIAIIGLGNVGQHLGERLNQADVKINEVVNRGNHTTLEYAKEWNCSVCSNIASIQSDIIFICVQDRYIADVVHQIPSGKTILITSGSAPLSELIYKGKLGAFYPMQTFSKNQPVDWNEVSILLESQEEDTLVFMKEIAALISPIFFECTGNERLKYHLACVWVNNFTNLILEEAQEFCRSENIHFENIKPLLKETINKIHLISNISNQTGPARRGDLNTIARHLTLMDSPKKELYEYLSGYIIKKFNYE